MTKRISKWRTRGKTHTNIKFDGHSLKSKDELRIAEQLKELGVSISYESDSVPYIKQHTYKPDFKLPNGIYIEVKGYFEPSDRTKTIEVLKQHPHLDIRFVFSNSKTKLNKSSKTTYGAWCEKHGIKYADKFIPLEWLNEKPK